MHTRRNWLTLAAAIVGISLAGGASVALSQGKLKVAAVYTVPVEQQWVSRIHKALNDAKGRGEIEYVFSEKVANADYERVMRELNRSPLKPPRARSPRITRRRHS